MFYDVFEMHITLNMRIRIISIITNLNILYTMGKLYLTIIQLHYILSYIILSQALSIFCSAKYRVIHCNSILTVPAEAVTIRHRSLHALLYNDS